MRLPADIDKECERLCTAINCIPGLQTYESCCGHGKSQFRIWFFVHDIAALPQLLYWIDACHIGFNWHCKVTTDCAKSPARFFIESESLGALAYKQADDIANAIEKDK